MIHFFIINFFSLFEYFAQPFVTENKYNSMKILEFETWAVESILPNYRIF